MFSESALPRRFFNLNIRHKDASWRASTFLANKKVEPLAPIFYGTRTISQLRGAANGSSGLRSKELAEAQQFLNLLQLAGDEGFQPVIVTIDEGRVWIYEPTAGPYEYDSIPGFSGEPDGILVKAYEVRHLVDPNGIPASEVPLVLSSMKVNQAFSRNTFKQIHGGEFDRYKGNIAALKAVLLRQPPVAPTVAEVDEGFAVDPLECLSAVEFETLVAKLFESDGCFVPAYRGGVMKDVDLYVYTEGAKANGLLPLPHEGVWNVQLKLSGKADKNWLLGWLDSDPRNVLITLDDGADDMGGAHHDRWITRDPIHRWLAVSREVSRWLERSLEWLPVEWRKGRSSRTSARAGAERNVPRG